MNILALSTIKIKRSTAIRCRHAGVWVTVVVLLASSSAWTQTSLISVQPRPPLPNSEPVHAGRIAEVGSPTGYVNGASSCSKRTGAKDCSSGGGPFRKFGEGVDGISAGGALFVRAGSYPEPIILTKKMEIRAYDGTVKIGPSSLAPFDLVAEGVDDNLLPLNPRWGLQTKSGTGLPDAKSCGSLTNLLNGAYGCEQLADLPCAHQITYLDCPHRPVYTPDKAFHATCIAPHVNWFGATYQGTIKWENHSCTLPCGDDDYNMTLERDDRAASTTANPDNIGLEFDSDETIDHFDDPTTRWWSGFRRDVDADGCKNSSPPCLDNTVGSRARRIDGSFAIVTGLVGLDCEHECHTEVHPVWALAINVQHAVDGDLWAFFVRNWGNEGFCGTSQHFIDFPNNKYTFRLPWKPGKTSVDVISKSFHAYHTTKPEPTVRKVPGEGVFVTFTLDAPKEDGSMWDGELRLKWSGG